MKEFNLSEWLKDKSRKVVTRDGRPVRILCTDAKAKDGCCIIAAIETDGEEEGYQFYEDGRAYSSKSCIEDCADLFFADEEEELEAIDNNTQLALEFTKEFNECIEKQVPKECAALIVLQDLAYWKDQHPKKGLWDAEKVITWIALHAELYGGFNQGEINSMCEDLRKAMEE